ncbi:MAG: glycosyltransferase family 2 protein [Phocaeicola sp.]
MTGLETLFWSLLALVVYTYLGYGLVLWLLVKIRKIIKPRKKYPKRVNNLPDVTLFITAYNEERVVEAKMKNCYALNYPKQKLHIVWVTDGSNDNTNKLLQACQNVKILHDPQRKGKTAAMNRGMAFVETPIVVFTDANTALNPESINEIVHCFENKEVGCVAGEKRIHMEQKEQAAAGGEGLYWKYESLLKRLDSELYSTTGAAGELFAIRTSLFEVMPNDTLLDDFILSMRIVEKGYRIAYCNKSYTVERGSANMKEEKKRKIRIAAGGLQSIYRLRALLNPFKYGIFSFQYLSHRVLRWSITPFALFSLLPINIALMIASEGKLLFGLLLTAQVLFYTCAILGKYLSYRGSRKRRFYIPYYFLFMNLNVIRSISYLTKKKDGTWEKAQRAVNIDL